MFDNIKIGQKLVFGYLVVLFLTIVVGAVGIYSANAMNEKQKIIYENDTKGISLAKQASLDFALVRVALRSAILYTDSKDINAEIQLVSEKMDKVQASLKTYQEGSSAVDTDAMKQSFNEAKDNFERYTADIPKVLDLARQNKDEEAFQMLLEMQPVSEKAINALDDLADANDRAAQNDNQASEALYSQMTYIIIGVVLVAVLAGLAIGISLSQSITNPLQKGLVMMQEMSLGHLGTRLRYERGDEIGILARAMDSFADDLQNNVVASMKKIASGDLNITITPKDNQDEISPALARSIDTLKLLLSEINRMSREQNAGDLDAKINADLFTGAYKEAAQGVVSQVFEHIRIKRQIVEVAQQYSQGNFNTQLERLPGKKAFMSETMDRVRESLREMLTNITDAANNLGSASAEILAATTQQASGASEQSAAITQTTTTVNEVKVISEQASARAMEVANASQRTVEVARGGQRSVQDTIESMNMIKDQVESISENLLALSDQTQQIGEIIASVNDIAAQSNMLALNASVEAARAGEHGKGFAVVAMEVRNLAEQSRQATAQIKSILSEIQKATNTTVMATEEGTKGVERGVQLAAQAQEAIQQLSAVINESAQIATQVVAGGQQQQTGIEQIALAMQNINQATVQSLASTRQAEKSAQNLNDLARNMNELVAKYRKN